MLPGPRRLRAMLYGRDGRVRPLALFVALYSGMIVACGFSRQREVAKHLDCSISWCDAVFRWCADGWDERLADALPDATFDDYPTLEEVPTCDR